VKIPIKLEKILKFRMLKFLNSYSYDYFTKMAMVLLKIFFLIKYIVSLSHCSLEIFSSNVAPLILEI